MSVEISTIASSNETLSPTFFNQRVIVPSVTDSPSAGSNTFTVAEPVEVGAAGVVTTGATGAGSGIFATGFSTTGATGGVGVGAGGGVCTTGAVGCGAPWVAPFASPITAITAPTAITESCAALISNKTPATGEGISVSTLSVETSTMASSTLITSPTFFNQRVTVPSVTDSPSWGIVTLVAI